MVLEWPLHSDRLCPSNGLCLGHSIGTKDVAPLSFYEGDYKVDKSSADEHHQADRPSSTEVECASQQEHANSANFQKHSQKGHRFFHVFSSSSRVYHFILLGDTPSLSR